MKHATLSMVAVALLAASCSSPENKTPEPAPVAPRDLAPDLAHIQRFEDTRQAADALGVYLNDPEASVRRRAVVALGRIGDPKSIPDVATLLSDPDQATVEEAIYALGQIGAPAGFDRLQPFLASPEPVLRALALEAISRFGEPGYASYAQARVNDGNWRVRGEVALALARMNEKATTDESKARMREAVLSLKPLLKDPDLRVRWRTACALGRMDPEPLRTELEAATLDQDPLVRAFSVRALGKIKDVSAAPFVVASHDMDERVAWEAVAALATREGDDAATALSDAAMSGESVKIARAIEALGEWKRVDPAFLKRMAKHPSPTVRGAALVASAWKNGEAAFGDAMKALSDPAVQARRAGVRALVAIGGERAQEELVKILGGEDQAMRLQVLEAIESPLKRAPERKNLWDPLILVGLQVNDLAVRGTAVGLLEGRTEPEWIKPLEDAWRASSGPAMADAREAILAQFEAMKRGEAVAEEGLKDSSRSVRVQAAKTLKAAGGRDVPAEPPPPAGAVTPAAVDTFYVDPVVKIETDRGVIRIRLMPRVAPTHVTAFVRLVKDGFYNGKSWHRVVPNFVIQGGDPRGDGWGDAGFSLRDEISREAYEAGTVGMAKAGKDTGSCQLFITSVPTPHLDGRYTVFGRVIEGMDVVRAIEVGDRIVKATLDR